MEKVEKTMPVSARVDLTNLVVIAEVVEREFGNVRSLSAVVRKGIDLLADVLRENGMVRVEYNLVEAVRWFEVRGLISRGMKKKWDRKLTNSLVIDSVRKSGGDPKVESRRNYWMVYKDKEFVKDSAETLGVGRDEIDRLTKVYEELERKGVEIVDGRKNLSLSKDDAHVDKDRVVKGEDE